MPSITAIPVPVPGYVYVEADFSDVGTATSICVDRVHPDGTRFPLRPYVSYDTEGCLNASCGLGIWWDTELPFDTEVTYCATGNDAAGDTILTPAPALITDTFTRVVAAGWGTADTGQAWTSTGGLAADYSVTGTRGQHAVPTVNVDRLSTVAMTTPNARAQVTMIPGAVATVDSFEMQLRLRADVANLNFYRILLSFDATGNVDLFFQKRVAGVATTLGSSANAFAYIATTQFNAVLEVWGSQIRAKVWDASTPEPAAWTFTVTDTSLSAPDQLGLATFRSPANTNAGLAAQYDNLVVSDVCAVPVPLEVCSSPVTIDSDGCFRLGDPVRPCNDRTVCFTEEECPEEPGIYFSSMGEESYDDNSGQLLPVNAPRAITVNRERRDTASQLNLVTALFADRDDVLALLEPGSPLLWRGPAEYGTGDRYMSIFDVGVTRSFPDHRIQARVFAMPWTAEDAPVGPSLGVCGTRIMDMCDVYPTLDAMVAAGLTYADLLRGAAGTGVAVTMADWNEVNADFTDWDDVNASETDWDDVLAGNP